MSNREIYMNDKVKYIFNINKTENAYYCDCNEAFINDERKLLHNEVGFSFIICDDKIKVTSGWHIGTENFEFNESKDDCNYYVDYYHPGLLNQVIDSLINNN